ncbi:type IV pilus secretin PilQ [Nitrospinaceae bacterium]|nr:type IV pilus secretin PilQ [Nitrospinaceae bacterium]
MHKTLLIFYGIFFIALINGLSSCVPVNKNTKPGAQKEGRLLNQKPTQIVSLNTKVGDDDEMVVRIKASDNIHYSAFKGTDPLRLVLDIPNTKKGRLSDVINVRQGVVDNIRTFYSEDGRTLRLEIILSRSARYHIKKIAGDELTVQLYDAVTEQVKTTKTKAQVNSKEIDPETSSEKVAVGEKVNVPVDPCESLLGGKKDRIDLDFQNASLPNTLRVFSEVSGFNIIIADEVKGNINLRLHNVPWNQAFEIILANNQLQIQCIGDNIVNVTGRNVISGESVARNVVSEQETPVRRSVVSGENMVTEVKRINYGQIEDVAKNLDSLRSESGNITIDTRTNTLILADLRPNIEKMLEFITILDKKSPQVMIEARIVTVSTSYSKELGIEWGLTGAILKSNNRFTRETGEDFNNQQGEIRITSGTGTVGAKAELVNLGTTSTATSGIGILAGNIISGLDLDMRLTAMESAGRGRVLSAPKVTTMDHREAHISSGRRIPYETTSQEGTATQFIDAELSLTVTPHVTSDDNVFLQIQATKNAADFANTDGNGNPTITTNEAKSEVVVANGATTVLGGIFENTKTETEKKVPFLSAIPIVGQLFQNMDDEDTVSEILIFITPTIVMDNKDTLKKG